MGRPSDDLATAQKATEAVQEIHAAALSPKPLERAYKLQLLLGQTALRGLTHGLATLTLLPLHANPETFGELMALQQAVVQRLAKQHKGWLEGCAVLAKERSRIKEANTLSKFVEQEYNLFAQFGALVADQLSQSAGLLENVQVDYGYWIARQAEQPVGAG